MPSPMKPPRLISILTATSHPKSHIADSSKLIKIISPILHKYPSPKCINNTQMYLTFILSYAIFSRVLAKFGLTYEDLEKIISSTSSVPGPATQEALTVISEKWSMISRSDASEHLVVFYGQIKTFSHENKFLYKEFESKHKVLETVLALIESWVIRENHNHTVNQLMFTKEAFSSLVSSMRLLVNIPNKDVPIYDLIRNVIGYKTLVLTFFNSNGSLNIEIDHLPEKISSMSDDLTAWESYFRLLSRVRVDLKMVFEFELIAVRQSIDELRCQIPKKKEEVVDVEVTRPRPKGVDSQWTKWG